MSSNGNSDQGGGPRQRLSREDRFSQLVSIAWQVIGNEGTDALTLGRLAERSAISKPVVYDHFPTRPALLAALYQDFDRRQTAIMDVAIAVSAPTLTRRATVIADAYIECVRQQGREIPGIIAALAGSPELARIKREYQGIFLEKCRTALTPFTGGHPIGAPGLWAMLGAAEALSEAAASGDISADQAQGELFETIVALVDRRTRAKPAGESP